jgi:hypothetical protein
MVRLRLVINQIFSFDFKRPEEKNKANNKERTPYPKLVGISAKKHN